jgi:hypothetical protein
MGGHERSIFVTELAHASERAVYCSKISSSVTTKRREDRRVAIPTSSAVELVEDACQRCGGRGTTLFKYSTDEAA